STRCRFHAARSSRKGARRSCTSWRKARRTAGRSAPATRTAVGSRSSTACPTRTGSCSSARQASRKARGSASSTTRRPATRPSPTRPRQSFEPARSPSARTGSGDMQRLIEIATERRVTVAMCAVAVGLFGMVSLSRLDVNLLPDIAYPTVTIRTELTGAAPIEVENLLTKPIEEAVGVIRNVRLVRSVSRSGQSDVTLEFAWGTDMDIAGVDVREKIDVVELPLEASRPLLLRFDPSTEPVLRLGLLRKSTAGAATEAELKALRRLAEDRIKNDLEAEEGTAAVKVSGGLEDEIEI